MHLLLLGANGQVGWELQRALAPLGRVTALDFDTPGEVDGVPLAADFSQPERLRALVQALKPSAIVNAAAHTAVDKAESEPDLVHTINATSPGVLAEAAAAAGVPLVHYSTDYVFDGSGDAPRDEDAAPGPLSVYGRSKLAGEQAIRAAGGAHLILRTSWVYAARGGNFARTMLKLAAEREELKVIDDQIGAPTGADLLADVTAHTLRMLLREPGCSGTYHCVAGGETSWHGYARLVVDWALAHGVPLKVRPERVLPVPTSAWPTQARRPLNSRLATARLCQTFGLTLPPWQQGVQRMLAEIHGR
jgi:dTDP-4-dehydrorhamnose reductase